MDSKQSDFQFEYKDGILISRFLKSEKVSLESAKQLVQARKDFQKEKNVKLVSVFPKLTSASKEARDYLATEEAKEGLSACAVVGKSPVARVIINFYLNINKVEDMPLKMFNNETDALHWLEDLD